MRQWQLSSTGFLHKISPSGAIAATEEVPTIDNRAFGNAPVTLGGPKIFSVKNASKLDVFTQPTTTCVGLWWVALRRLAATGNIEVAASVPCDYKSTQENS